MKIRRRVWGHRCRNAALALLLAPLLSLWLPALSVAQPPAASEAKTAPLAPEEPAPAGTDAPAPPPAPVVSPEPSPAPLRESVAVALVLPLQSTIYGRAAEAVKAGFLAAAAAAGSDARYEIIGHGDGDVRTAFDKAKEAGARVIVGPLVRDDLKTIAAADGDLPWTIALNQLDEGSALPPHVYTLALAVESEGVQLARRAHQDGARSIVVIGSDAPLQKRFASAFVGEWILLGGAAPVTFHFDRAPDMLALLRREFAKAAPDAVLLALNAQDAALAKPYLGQVIAYTSSQINDPPPRESLRDLDGIRFVEIPWLADPAAAAFARVARPDYGNPTLDRLYALGIDAFSVAQAFADGAPDRLEFDGATGHVALDRSRQFLREATVLQFQDGEIVAAGPR